MDVADLRNYGVALTDAEAGWPADVKTRMIRTGKAVVMRNLGLLQKIRFGLAFIAARRRAARADLSAIRARGMRNESFLATQREFLSLYSALAQVLGTDRALEVMRDVMDATAREPMMLTLPDLNQARQFPDPLRIFAEYFRAAIEPCRRSGSSEITFVEETDDAFQFDATWCVWLELARTLGVPEACTANCYADELVFPDYFAAVGIRFCRRGTLARGAACCDFRFERAHPGVGPG